MSIDATENQRRFSETVAIDNSQVSQASLQFALPIVKKEKSEVMMRSVSLPRGTKMEVQLSGPPSLVERKQFSLKQRAEAVSTLRQELMIPLMQQRSFSETVAIDNQRQEEMLLHVQDRSSSRTQLNVERLSAPRAIKMEVEVPRPKKELSRCEFQRKRRVEATHTQRQEMRLHLDGGKPVFLEELAPQKVRFD